MSKLDYSAFLKFNFLKFLSLRVEAGEGPGFLWWGQWPGAGGNLYRI